MSRSLYIAPPSKKGREDLWVFYAVAQDATTKAIVKVSVAAYVEKVCEQGSFGGLRIGA